MNRQRWHFGVLAGLALLAAFCPAGTASADFIHRLDLNSGDSPTQTDYTPVALAEYSASAGYGWGDISGMDTRDRGGIGGDPISDLVRDFHFHSADRTFLVDLAPGTYDLTLYFRDSSSGHDNVQVFAEGDLVVDEFDILTTANVIHNVTVAVTDGQLNLTIHDNGGGNPHWTFSGLDIAPEPTTLVVLLLAAAALPRRRR